MAFQHIQRAESEAPSLSGDKLDKQAPMADSDPEPKRLRVSREDDSDSGPVVTPAERPLINPHYGQKSAFPGLDDAGDELTYDEPDGAMEYLRMVRSEASALPKFFIASASKEEVLKSAQDKNTGSATPGPWSSLPAGFDEDEACIAPAKANVTIASPQDALPETQAICYDLLRHRFRLLRSTLRCTPSAAAIAALDDSHPISLPRHHEAARKEWRRLILSVDPRMAQLACMDSHSVLGALGIVARELSEVVRSENAQSIRRMGAWVWGILGKCRDVGELATEEVGAIRDLGKRAVRIFEKIGEANNQFLQDGPDSDSAEDNQPENEAPQDDPEQEVMQQVEVVGTGDSDIPDATNESDDLEAAKARLQAQLQGDIDNNPTDDTSAGDKEYMIQLTRAMLDMILTVVGEFFGQRDLLEARQIWGQLEHARDV